MSSETRQYSEGLLAVSPWMAFAVAVAWCWALELRNNVRSSRAYERKRLRRPEKKARAQDDDEHVIAVASGGARLTPPRTRRLAVQWGG
jgi:hypothetical protein